VVYLLEPLLILLLFAREKQSAVVLHGATYHALDVSVDCVRSVLIPILKKRFGCTDIRISLKTRALGPSGGGEVRLTVGSVQNLRTIEMTECGMVKKVRGLCYTISMAPTLANRVRTKCNDVLYDYLSDVWIFSDMTSRGELERSLKKISQFAKESAEGNANAKREISAGYGLTLIAESTTGVLLSVHELNEEVGARTAEEFGDRVARMLLEEIGYGGTVDTAMQGMVLLLMALCTEDVSRVRLGRISKHSVALLRLIRQMLGVKFKVKQDPMSGTVFASCMGAGYSNIWRQAS